MGATVNQDMKDIAEELEDVKVSRRRTDKLRTLERRQARQTKDFIRNNG